MMKKSSKSSINLSNESPADVIVINLAQINRQLDENGGQYDKWHRGV